jgi:hypothetical protein
MSIAGKYDHLVSPDSLVDSVDSFSSLQGLARVCASLVFGIWLRDAQGAIASDSTCVPR